MSDGVRYGVINQDLRSSMAYTEEELKAANDRCAEIQADRDGFEIQCVAYKRERDEMEDLLESAHRRAYLAEQAANLSALARDAPAPDQVTITNDVLPERERIDPDDPQARRRALDAIGVLMDERPIPFDSYAVPVEIVDCILAALRTPTETTNDGFEVQCIEYKRERDEARATLKAIRATLAEPCVTHRELETRIRCLVDRESQYE